MEDEAETVSTSSATAHWFVRLLNWLSLLLLLSVVAARLSRTARFYFRSALLYLFIMVNAVLSVPYGLLHFGQFRRNALFSAWLSRAWDQFLGVTWRVEEEAPPDSGKGYIIVCNHQSSLDTYGMMRIWHKFGLVQTIVKKELLWTGPFGLNLYLNGSIFLDRASGAKGRETLNAAVRNAKARGASIWIYPEGTRNGRRDLSLLPFKKGAFHMALDAGMDILPVVISEYHFFNPARKVFDDGVATIRILKPIPTEGYSKDTMDELIEKTRETMTATLKQISKGSSTSQTEKKQQ